MSQLKIVLSWLLLICSLSSIQITIAAEDISGSYDRNTEDKDPEAPIELTEESVKHFISQMEGSIKAKDAQGLIRLMSPQIIIKAHIKMNGEEQALTPSREEYIAMTEQAFAMYSDYQYERLDTEITIEDVGSIPGPEGMNEDDMATPDTKTTTGSKKVSNKKVGNKEAVVTATIRETIVVDGVTRTTTTNELMVIKVLDEDLYITQLYGYTEM